MNRIPYLKTDNQIIDDAFRIAYGDLTGNIRFFKDGLLAQERLVILAGLAYDTPWTRDTSINIWNGGGLLYPEVAKNTLLSVLYDDNGTIRAGGQYWDAIIWTIGAWSYYLYTGDEEFLEYAYPIVKNSLAFFEDTEFNEELNLFRGGSCYGDGIAAYPDVYATHGHSGIVHLAQYKPEMLYPKGEGVPMHTLSTNCLYYMAYVIADKMAKHLQLPEATCYIEKAENMKNAINKHFWMEDKGYYRYIVDDYGNCDCQEGMGQSFVILFGIADERQIQRIFESQYVTENGIACLWPCFDRYRQFGEHEYGRHSGTVWPHIQGFWADAAASYGRADLFRKELLKLSENAVRNSFFSEIYHPTNGTPYGGLQEDEGKGIRKRFPSYPRQTWSATAYIRMVLFGLVGMKIAEDGIRFAPTILDEVKQITLKNITYRKMVLHVTIAMTGDRIRRFVVNGTEQETPFIPCDKEGEVDIIIE